MELQSFLEKLDKVKKSGDGYVALCPAHADKKHSLSIAENDGKLLVKCFAGCTTEAITSALGLTMTDLFIEKKAARAKVVETYNYTDENGDLLFQVCRLQPKSFRQRHQDANGNWVWDMKGVRRVLYHLPDIIKAPEVYFVEGEKDAENLGMCGMVTTTSPGGANSWKDEYAEPLIGKKVVLIPDNDEAGYAYMRDVASSLMGKAELSCILLPDKDISDWLAKKHHVDDLPPMHHDISVLLEGRRASYQSLDGVILWQHDPVQFKAENIRQERTGLHAKTTILHKYQPLAWSVFNVERSEERTKLARSAFANLKPEIKNTYTEADLKRDFDLFCADLWPYHLSHYSPELVYGDATIAPLSFLLYPYIMQGGGTILFAPPGRGKSNTALLWAQSINSGVNLFWQVHRSPVLFINLERSRETIQRRLSAVNKILGLPPVTPLRILNARGQSLNNVMDSCRKAIKQFGIGLVILDSISRSGFGDLTENRPVNAIIDGLSSLATTWVALAHTPRSDETHIYGGVMFEAGADIVVKLSSAVSNNGTLGIGYEITKANDLKCGGLTTYAMEFGDNGLEQFRRARPYEFPEIEGQTKKPILETIKDFLFEQDMGDASATDIANATGLSRPNIAALLSQSGQFTKTRSVGRSQYYGVKETHAS